MPWFEGEEIAQFSGVCGRMYQIMLDFDIYRFCPIHLSFVSKTPEEGALEAPPPLYNYLDQEPHRTPPSLQSHLSREERR